MHSDKEEPAVYLLAPVAPRIYGPSVANLFSRWSDPVERDQINALGLWRRFLFDGMRNAVYPLAEFGIIPATYQAELAPYPNSAHLVPVEIARLAVHLMADQFLTGFCIETIQAMSLDPLSLQKISVACLPGGLVFMREPSEHGLPGNISGDAFKIQRAASYHAVLADQSSRGSSLDFIHLTNVIVALVRAHIENLIDEAEAASDTEFPDHRGMRAYLTPKLK
jgi:hypothetical protein